MEEKMNGIGRRLIGGLFAAFLALVLLSNSALAETLRLPTAAQPTTNTNPQSQDGAAFLDLSDVAGIQAVRTFSTAVANSVVVVTFNAECAVAAPAGNFINWLNVDILIDGVVIPPTTSDNAFCTSNGTAGSDGWVSAVSTGVRIVPLAGNHTVQVRVNDQLAGWNWWIDDSTLVVESQP